MKKIFYHVVTEKPMKTNQKIIFDETHHSMKELVDKVYDKKKVIKRMKIKLI